MRLLLFSDLHCRLSATRAIVEAARDADVVVGAGDFGNQRRGVSKTIDLLSSIDKPTVLVAGNNESADELESACRKWPIAKVLQGSMITIEGVEFFGIGGGIPVTPFGSWSWDFTEEQAAGLLADCPAGCVLVSHSPPQGAVDVSSAGIHLGSVAVRNSVLEKKPQLVVCGHIHNCGGKSELVEGVPIVNAGPDGMWWDLTI